MSHAATTWAFTLAITPATTKFVLVALADYANKKWLAWPSTRALEQKTCLDRKTIFVALKQLRALGFIEDIGDRIGKTKRVPIYALKQSQKRNSSENGIVPKTERLTVPKTELLPSTGNIFSEPSIEPSLRKTPFKPENATLPFDSENFQNAWRDWCKLRTEIHKPLTETAVKQQLRKCQHWGEDRSLAALEASTANSYQGLFEPKIINGSQPNKHEQPFRVYV